MSDVYWTYKTLKMSPEGTAEWLAASFRFPTVEEAIGAAGAYMAAHAANGHMVVVSLEPSPELKPTVDRLAEHTLMLDALKSMFSDHQHGGQEYLWRLIHQLDPEWPNPFRESRS